MAVRSKTGTAPLQHLPGKPKLTRQGQWQAVAAESWAQAVTRPRQGLMPCSMHLHRDRIRHQTTCRHWHQPA
jgi:hypothetical protein